MIDRPRILPLRRIALSYRITAMRSVRIKRMEGGAAPGSAEAERRLKKLKSPDTPPRRPYSVSPYTGPRRTSSASKASAGPFRTAQSHRNSALNLPRTERFRANLARTLSDLAQSRRNLALNLLRTERFRANLARALSDLAQFQRNLVLNLFRPARFQRNLALNLPRLEQIRANLARTSSSLTQFHGNSALNLPRLERFRAARAVLFVNPNKNHRKFTWQKFKK